MKNILNEKSYGIISAWQDYKSVEQNEDDHSLLEKELEGFLKTELKGVWKSYNEKSFLVSGIAFEMINILAIKFDQDAFVFSESNTVVQYNKNGEVLLSCSREEFVEEKLPKYLRD